MAVELVEMVLEVQNMPSETPGVLVAVVLDGLMTAEHGREVVERKDRDIMVVLVPQMQMASLFQEVAAVQVCRVAMPMPIRILLALGAMASRLT